MVLRACVLVILPNNAQAPATPSGLAGWADTYLDCNSCVRLVNYSLVGFCAVSFNFSPSDMWVLYIIV